MDSQSKETKLVALIEKFRTAIVAFSGGVDSSYLAFMTHRVLGEESLMVTGLSPSVSQRQEKMVRDFVDKYDLRHRFVETQEMEDPNYRKNPSNRCYFCKSELFGYLDRVRAEWEFEVVFDGSNADDADDHRPGHRAAREENVVSPLMEVGMTKEDIRERSLSWGLETWDLPSMPCLSSRLPYGVEVTREKLLQVEKAEDFLREIGFREFRVRHHEELARIEVAEAEMRKMLNLDLFSKINEQFRRIGYHYVTLDLEGFRSGSLNELLQLDAE